MNRAKHLKIVKDRKYDEYYTRYEHVEHIFKDIIPEDALRDKIIYLPCDSDESNFTIYLKQHRDDIGYRELIYTSDDYKTHYDLFEYCDVVITNPPFSDLLSTFIPILNKVNKKFFILGGKATIYSYFRKFELDDVKFIKDNEYYDFIVPDENIKPNAAYIYISNMQGIDYEYVKYNDIFTKPKMSDVYNIVTSKQAGIYDKMVKTYDRLAYIPEDYDDFILVPITAIYEHNRKYFDLYNKVSYNRKYSDGKTKYCRVLAKIKPLLPSQG